MKQITENKKRLALLLVICLFGTFLGNSLSAQVFTRILNENEQISEFIPWHFDTSPHSIALPKLDIEAVLEEDERQHVRTPRFGVKAPMNLDKNDGEFFTFGNYTVWKLKISSAEAQSLNFEFSNLNLPEGSEMFIHGMDGKMIHGPVDAAKVFDGIYASDIVLGSYAVIEVFLPEQTEKQFSIQLDNAVHGIDKSKIGRDFGDSGSCNINVGCPAGVGAGLDEQINSVCLILRDNASHCTGALVNNEANDLRPFLLTANHCVDNFASHNWVFRFNYESATCAQTVEPHSSLWISFSGAVLRASSAASDFALLELNSSVAGTGVGFSGWDRTNSSPTATTGVHHPSGDVKKICFDVNAPVVNGAFHDVVWDMGTTEPGSSGSPLYDPAGRIIGQLFGGAASCGNPSGIDNYGRIFNSWTGGGTAATSLSSWLGPLSNPTTSDPIAVPSITGDPVLCTSNKTYTLNNPLPGYGIVWTATPASLFGSATSGVGANAVLRAASSSSQGAATLTYTLNNATFGPQTFTQTIWVGKPLLTGIRTPQCFTKGSNTSVMARATGATSYMWSFPGCPSGPPVGDPTPGCWFNYSGGLRNISVHVGQQSGSISVWASNECGSSSINKPIVFCDNDDPGPGGGPIIRSITADDNEYNGISVLPNPASDLLTVALDQDYFLDEEPKELQLFDMNGKVVYRITTVENQHQIRVSDFPASIYFLKVGYQGAFAFKKIIVL